MPCPCYLILLPLISIPVRFDEADELIARMIETAPESAMIPVMKGFVAQQRGDAEVAIEHLQNADDMYSLWGRAIAYYDLGRDAESDAVIEELVRTDASSVILAIVYAHRGETDRAFEWLERAYEEHDSNIVEIRMNSTLDVLHKDPRWEGLVQRIGMTDEVAESIGL